MRRLRLLSALLPLVIGLCLSACAKRSGGASAHTQTAKVSQTKSVPETRPRVNINTASAKELEALPGIGKGLAERIVEHRAKYGPFRRTEHLIIVRGISDARFRALRDLITVE